MRSFVLLMILLVIVSYIKDVNADGSTSPDDSLLLKQIAQCELAALRLGSEIADVFNSPVGREGWSERVHQDYITENLGFAPFMSKGLNRGLTLTKSNAKALQEKGNWTGKSIDDSPYKVLNHKWVYMYGDSTTRQVWASYAAPFQGNNFERNSKEWTRQYCSGQNNRVRHAKFGDYPNEGWRGPCGKNEVTCHVSGYGERGLLTFDWKHFPYEDYDEWLFGVDGAWNAKPAERRPDILTVQLGLHTCWHSHTLNHSDIRDYSQVNHTMIERHIASIPTLMTAVRTAINRPSSDGNRTRLVVIVTSGSSGMPDAFGVDDCILRINRVVAQEAHKQGFAVLERGEIERRVMYKSLLSEDPYLISEMHLSQPVQNIVATCLLKLFTCLDAQQADIYSPEIATFGALKTKPRPADARPLHSAGR